MPIMCRADPLLLTVIYYIICYSHGDFSPEHLGQADWLPCISEIDGFAATFLFSLETQHTIGYGTRQTTTNCPHAILLMSVQVGERRNFFLISMFCLLITYD